MNRTRVLCALAAVILAAAVGPAVPAQADTTTALAGDVVHHLDAATLVGPVGASQPITVGVFLNNPNQAAEDAYVNSLYDPSSANYQNFLDPDTFNTQFGVPAATFQAAQTWLTGGGLQVTTIPGATNYLLASGTAAQVSALFATPLNNYSAGGRSFYANAVAPTVPSSLGVSTVLGLNNFNHFTTPHVSATGTPTITTAAPGTNVPQTGLLTPQALWSIYDQPSTNMGNGQTMAIFGWGVTDGVVNDLRNWEQEFKLPQVPITIRNFGATDTPPTSGDGATEEWELDTQASTGMAPNV
jgi:kumamolisin